MVSSIRLVCLDIVVFFISIKSIDWIFLTRHLIQLIEPLTIIFAHVIGKSLDDTTTIDPRQIVGFWTCSLTIPKHVHMFVAKRQLTLRH